MRMAIEAIPVVAGEFLDEVLLPKTHGGTQSFMAAFVMGLAGQRIKAMAAPLADEQGTVDLDELANAAKSAIAKSGYVQIPAIGYRADADDIERIVQIARRHGG